MIKARAVIRNGFFSLEFSGHGRPDVCAGASAIMVTAALGLKKLAEDYPKQLAFAQDVEFKDFKL